MKVVIEDGKVMAQAENVEEVKSLLAMNTSEFICNQCQTPFKCSKGLNVHMTKMHVMPRRETPRVAVIHRHMPMPRIVRPQTALA